MTVREKPALAAVAAFVVAVPLLLLAFGGGDPVSAVDETAIAGPAPIGWKVAGLLDKTRALFDEGQSTAAAQVMHQADLLFPVAPEKGRSRMTLAAEREVDRLDRIDQLAEEARIAIGRSEFRKARSKIDRLAEIGGPPGTVRFLEGRLDHSLRKVRTTQQARVVQPQPLQADTDVR